MKETAYMHRYDTSHGHHVIRRVRGAIDKIYSSTALPAKACGNLGPHANLAIVYKYKQVDRNPDHVGHKLLEPRAELMQASTTERSDVT